MDFKDIGGLILSQVILSGLGIIGTYKVLQFKVDELRKEVELQKQEHKSLVSDHNSHGKEIAQMKQLLTTTHSMVGEMHGQMFKYKEPDSK